MFNLLIDVKGNIKFIYSDNMTGLLTEGVSQIKRASHVEPAEDNTWQADMRPVGGPILTGYLLRQDALNAEILWINQNVLGGSQ